MVNCHIKKYLIIFFVFVQGAVAFSCASDDEVLEVVDLSVNKEVVDFKSEAGTQNITVSTNAPTWEAKADKKLVYAFCGRKDLESFRRRK